MKNDFEIVLRKMYKKELVRITRAANMICFSFGESVPFKNYKNCITLKSEYAIHIESVEKTSKKRKKSNHPIFW